MDQGNAVERVSPSSVDLGGCTRWEAEVKAEVAKSVQSLRGAG